MKVATPADNLPPAGAGSPSVEGPWPPLSNRFVPALRRRAPRTAAAADPVPLGPEIVINAGGLGRTLVAKDGVPTACP